MGAGRGAEGGIRTHMGFPPGDFKSPASTDFATPAELRENDLWRLQKQPASCRNYVKAYNFSQPLRAGRLKSFSHAGSMPHPYSDFVHSDVAEPHRGRTKEILRKYPQIRSLIGPNPNTFWYGLGLVLLQLTLATAVANTPWWVVFAVAYCIGAFANHSLFVVVHECAHRLVIRERFPNFLTGVISNLPLFFPSAVSFQKYHLKHHAFQGIYELDADVPSYWEAKFIGHSALGKAVWLLFYPEI